MPKTLQKVGESLALVIDRTLLDLQKITSETKLEIRPAGRGFLVMPVRAEPPGWMAYDEPVNLTDNASAGVLRILRQPLSDEEISEARKRFDRDPDLRAILS